MDIRMLTCLIIRKDGKYLVGRDVFGQFKWSYDLWDAWRTRIRASTRSVQEKTGGEIMMFNPVVGKTKKYK